MSQNLNLRPKLSLCVIVKNEAQNLPRCLESVKPYVDETIVVDTGSSDNTVEIAQSYGAKVKYFQWCDDFAAARNYAISQASGEWILMLDADEQLVVESTDFLAEITASSEIVGYVIPYIEVTDLSEATPSYRTALFRNIPDLKYIGRFHEYLKYYNPNKSLNYIGNLKNIKILHYGFNKEQLQIKNISRNIPMLERIRQEEGLSIRLLTTLAGMYKDTQQLEKARECSQEIFERLLPHLLEGIPPDEFLFIPDTMYVLGVQFLDRQDDETARLLCQRGLEWCPNYPPLNYLAGAILRSLGFTLGAITYFENCLALGQQETYYKGESFDLNFMTLYPAYDLGCIFMEMELWQKALTAFELAVSFDPNFTEAKDKIEQIKQVLNV